ncbi:MAG TPA: hypothetical protein PLJ38_08440, partial [bacterium]|nr:hypothetical protein [bacterium]
MKVLLISLYCGRNFPIRIFQSILEKDFETKVLFFKYDNTNFNFNPTKAEWKLLNDFINEFNPDVICISLLS